MKEIRAIVLGLVVVLAIALAWGFVRRPAPGMKRVRALRVQFQGKEHGRTKEISLRIPGFLIGNAAKIASRAWEDEFSGTRVPLEFDGSEVTPQEVLDAADRSSPGHPAELKVGSSDRTCTVEQDGGRIRINVAHGAEDRVDIWVPRPLVEGLALEKPLTAREILEKLDRLGPGDLVAVKGNDGEVRISAEGR